jgi:hypothetical protein
LHNELVGNSLDHPRTILIKEMINRIPCLNVSYSELTFQHIKAPKEVITDIERRLQQDIFRNLAIGTLPKSLIGSICIMDKWTYPHSYLDEGAGLGVKTEVYQSKKKSKIEEIASEF